MVFQSKKDKFFITFVITVIFIISCVIFIPSYVFRLTTAEISFLIVLFLFMISCLLWMTFGIKYEFRDTYLHVKGAPFLSKILYRDITKVAPTNEIFSRL